MGLCNVTGKLDTCSLQHNGSHMKLLKHIWHYKAFVCFINYYPLSSCEEVWGYLMDYEVRLFHKLPVLKELEEMSPYYFMLHYNLITDRITMIGIVDPDKFRSLQG